MRVNKRMGRREEFNLFKIQRRDCKEKCSTLVHDNDKSQTPKQLMMLKIKSFLRKNPTLSRQLGYKNCHQSDITDIQV